MTREQQVMADIPCYPNGERVPGHVPATYSVDLFTAMGALYDQLSKLELDIEDTALAIEVCNSPRQRRGLTRVAERWEHQRAQLATFFDWSVYMDQPNNNGVTP